MDYSSELWQFFMPYAHDLAPLICLLPEEINAILQNYLLWVQKPQWMNIHFIVTCIATSQKPLYLKNSKRSWLWSLLFYQSDHIAYHPYSWIDLCYIYLDIQQTYTMSSPKCPLLPCKTLFLPFLALTG